MVAKGATRHNFSFFSGLLCFSSHLTSRTTRTSSPTQTSAPCLMAPLLAFLLLVLVGCTCSQAQPPSASVDVLVATALNSSFISVRWLAIAPSNWGSASVGYIVEFTLVPSQPAADPSLPTSGSVMLPLSNSTQSTFETAVAVPQVYINYVFRALAYNTVGRGPNAGLSKIGRTAEAGVWLMMLM